MNIITSRIFCQASALAFALFPYLAHAQLAQSATGGVQADSTMLTPTNPSAIGYGGGPIAAPFTPPSACSSTDVAWQVNNNECAGTLPQTASGLYSQAVNTAGGLSGGITYACSGGNWSPVPGTTSCASNVGPQGSNTLANAVVQEFGGAPGEYVLPGNAQQIAITLHNVAPPVVRGQYESSTPPTYIDYETVVQVLDQNGNTVQTIDAADEVDQMGREPDADGNPDDGRPCFFGLVAGGMINSNGTVYPSYNPANMPCNTAPYPVGATSGSAPANNNYNYPVTSQGRTFTLDLYNVPALYTIQIYTQMALCNNNSTTPASNTDISQCGNFGVPWVSDVTETSDYCEGAWFLFTTGDCRFGGHMEARNTAATPSQPNSGWHFEYVIAPTAATGTFNPVSNCGPTSFPRSGDPQPTLPNGTACTWSNVTGTQGSGVTVNGASQVTGGYTYTCVLSASCSIDFTQPGAAAAWSNVNMAVTSTSNSPGSPCSLGNPAACD